MGTAITPMMFSALWGSFGPSTSPPRSASCLKDNRVFTSLRRSALIVLHLYCVALAIDHLAVLGDRNINAGTPLRIDQPDGLGHSVWILTAVLHGFKA